MIKPEPRPFSPEIVTHAVAGLACPLNSNNKTKRKMKAERMFLKKVVLFMVLSLHYHICFTDVPLRDGVVERSSHGGLPHATMGDAMSTTKYTMSVPDQIASWTPGRFIENFFRRYRIQNCSFSTASHVMPVNDACPSCPCTEPGRHLRQPFQPCRHHEADP